MSRLFHALWHDYIDNASNTRDFRSQLRGNRVMLMWTIYVLVLTTISLLVYSSLTRDSAVTSIPQMQAQMQSYYRGMMVALSAAITIIAPVLTASAMADERIRQSIDLVITTPIAARNLLIGKVLSAMRFIAVLVFLALPAASVGVVLGGADWSEVFVHSVLILFSGAVLSVIGLVVGLTTPIPRQAVITSFLMGLLYQFGISFIAMILGARSMFGGAGTASPPESWLISLSPFVSMYRPITISTLGGVEIPNVVIAGLATILIVGVFVLGTAATLSSYCSKDVLKFRVISIILSVVMPPLIAFGLLGTSGSIFGRRMTSTGMGAGPSAWKLSAGLFHLLAGIFVLSIPVYFVVSRFGDRKGRFDGWFSFKKLLLHVPSSAMPFVLAMYLGGFFSMLVTQLIATRTFTDIGLFLVAGAYWLSLLWLLFSYSRLASRRELWDVRVPKRRVQVVPLVIFGGILAVLLGCMFIMAAANPLVRPSDDIFKIHPMYPIFVPDYAFSLGIGWTAFYAALGTILHRRNVAEYAVPPKFS
jgi:hypothetical protein